MAWQYQLSCNGLLQLCMSSLGFRTVLGNEKTVGILHVTERVMGTRGKKMASKRGCMCTEYFLKNISDLLVAG